MPLNPDESAAMTIGMLTIPADWRAFVSSYVRWNNPITASLDEAIYMMEKPWKYQREFALYLATDPDARDSIDYHAAQADA